LPRASDKENPELRYDLKTKKQRISRTTIEQFPRAAEDLDIKHEAKHKKGERVDEMKEYRETMIPVLGISPTQYEHKTVH
jgi:hypothetical protein